MLFGITLPAAVKNNKGEMVPGAPLHMVGAGGQIIGVSIWFVMLYAVADRWTVYVDPFCARLSHKFEKLVFEQDEKSALPS